MLGKLFRKLRFYLRTTKHYRNVRKFHKLALQDAPDKLIVPEDGGRILRAKLVLEEAMELIHALGITITVCSDKGNRIVNIDKNTNYRFKTKEWQLVDPVEVADGCADLNYVTTGTLVAFGIPDNEIQNEVDKNNLDKFKSGWSIRSDGKVLKSPLWQPPKIGDIVLKYAREGMKNKYLSFKERIKWYFKNYLLRPWRIIRWK